MKIDKERKIQEKIDQITRNGRNYRAINEEQKRRRFAWWNTNKDHLQLSGSLSKQAFGMVLFECMEINPNEIEVIYEDERKITWKSLNFCSGLEACKRLGLDTRVVCKKAYEESVEYLISFLHPNLHFSRNYQKIRPHAPYCEETIELKASCPFFEIEGRRFNCEIQGDSCGHDGNNYSECTKFLMLREEFIDYVKHEIRIGCARCGKVEIAGSWFEREEVFIPDIKSVIPLIIWQKLWDLIGKGFCAECQPEKEESKAS